MTNYLAIMMTVSSIICIRSKSQENLDKKKELWEYLKKKECHKQLLWEHQEIIRAIEAGEIDVATKITEQHIDNQVEAVSDALRHLEENQFRHV